MPNVFVINKSAHDFSGAERFGELIYLTEGRQGHFNVNTMVTEFATKLKDSKQEDYFVLTSLNVLCVIACAIFVLMHKGHLNVLLFRDGRYIPRELLLSQVVEVEKDD